MTSWSEKWSVAFEVVTIVSKPVTGVNRRLVTSPSGWLISRLVTSDREQPPDVPWCVLQVWLFPICGTTTFSDIVSWIRGLTTNDGLWAKSSPWATNAFYIFKWLKKRRVLCRDAWKLHEIQISLSISEVLLAHSHAHWFILCGLLLRWSGRRVWE